MNLTTIHRTLAKRLIAASLFSGMLTACCALSAQPVNGNDRPPRQPPAEALDACKSLSSGQDCSFTSPHGTVKGLCWAPEGKPLACKPKQPKDAPQGDMEKR